MGNQVAFDATNCSMLFLGGFFAEVSKEIGEYKAVELYARRGRTWGETMAQIIESHAGQANAAKQIQGELGKLFESLGLATDLERKTGS